MIENPVASANWIWCDLKKSLIVCKFILSEYFIIKILLMVGASWQWSLKIFAYYIYDIGITISRNIKWAIKRFSKKSDKYAFAFF